MTVCGGGKGWEVLARTHTCVQDKANLFSLHLTASSTSFNKQLMGISTCQAYTFPLSLLTHLHSLEHIRTFPDPGAVSSAGQLLFTPQNLLQESPPQTACAAQRRALPCERQRGAG